MLQKLRLTLILVMTPRLFAWGGFWQTVSYKLMMLCRDIYALLHVISLVAWPKPVKSLFFFAVDNVFEWLTDFAGTV